MIILSYEIIVCIACFKILVLDMITVFSAASIKLHPFRCMNYKFTYVCIFLHSQGTIDLSFQIRIDDEDDEITVNDQAVERLVIVTQVSS